MGILVMGNIARKKIGPNAVIMRTKWEGRYSGHWPVRSVACGSDLVEVYSFVSRF